MGDLTLFEALTGGAFDWHLSKIFQKSKMPRGLPGGGGMGGFGIDRYIDFVEIIKSALNIDIDCYVCDTNSILFVWPQKVLGNQKRNSRSLSLGHHARWKDRK